MNSIDSINERINGILRDSIKTSSDNKLRNDMTLNVIKHQSSLIQSLQSRINTLESTVSDLRVAQLTLQNKQLQQQVNNMSHRSRL